MRLRCLGSLLLWRNVCHGSKALKLRAFPSVKILALRSKKILLAFEIHSHIPSFGRTCLCAQCCSYVVFHALTYSTYELRGFNWKAFMNSTGKPSWIQLESLHDRGQWAKTFSGILSCFYSALVCTLSDSMFSVVLCLFSDFCSTWLLLFSWAIPKLIVILLNMNKFLGLWLLTSSFLLGPCLLPFLLYWLDISCLFSLISPHHVCT